MTNNDKHCPNGDGTIHFGGVLMHRLYVRKVVQGGPNKAYMQRYITIGWRCLQCGHMELDPSSCPKCSSPSIKPSNIKYHFDSRRDNDKKWECLDCKHKWLPKITKKSQKLIILT